MFRTRVTEILGIKYPIIQGGMMWISKAKLVSAVSNSGGLGILSALTFKTPRDLKEEIKKCRDLTDKPFGVNITFLPTLRPVNYESYIEAVIESGVKIVETAGRNPEPYMKTLKENKITVIHKCTSVRHAKKAESIGCDIVSIDGFECAGHPGEDDVTSLILIPRAVDEVKIPVIASGGFGDGRGLVAALSLGAEGINMGTRFLATEEAEVHPNIKKRLLEAKETDTILVEKSLKNSVRVLKNKHALKVKEMEERGATLTELAPLLSGLLGLKAIETGDTENALLACGQIVGLIKEIPTVRELIDSIIEDAEKIIRSKLCTFIQ